VNPVEAEAIKSTNKSNISKIALIGNPNSGKSSLFNQSLASTEGRQFPGVTVKTGISQLVSQQKPRLLICPAP